MNPPDTKVFMTGFMGAGKTTVGRMVAERMGVPFVDVDERIVQETGLTVAEIFAEQGEAAFRALERAAIATLAVEHGGMVIGLGGGAILDPNNQREIMAAGTLVWLEAQPETLLDRVSLKPGQRPLLEGAPSRDAKLEKIRSMLSSRQTSYALARVRISTDGKTPSAVADEVLGKLK